MLDKSSQDEPKYDISVDENLSLNNKTLHKLTFERPQTSNACKTPSRGGRKAHNFNFKEADEQHAVVSNNEAKAGQGTQNTTMPRSNSITSTG